MKITTLEWLTRFTAAVAVLITLINGALAQDENAETRPPELPAACSHLQVEEGNKVSFRVYAIGVQIYRWNGSDWTLFAPDAVLYADADYRGKVGTHYGGPTWESNSGSYVIASRVRDCTPDPSSVAWLLLRASTKEGPGIFGSTTFIQRVNTTGGVKPGYPGTFVGEEKRIPYTTEYYFYKSVADNEQ